jgi:uncharacterized protein (TIGR02246 family)
MNAARRREFQVEDRRMPEHLNEEQAAAESMLARFVESWNRADGAAYGDGYWPDAELVDPFGTIHTGRAAIEGTHVKLWAGIFLGSHIQGVVRRLRRLGPDYLLVDLDLEVTRFQQRPSGSPTDTPGVISAHLKHILERREGAWRILAAQNTFSS